MEENPEQDHSPRQTHLKAKNCTMRLLERSGTAKQADFASMWPNGRSVFAKTALRGQKAAILISITLLCTVANYYAK